ncbi:MAG TPA: tRNA (adenosine(37)-N6)-threonylcarbamoyltransferase complex transferase subunit TsaD [Coriobacteriia bacterium]
MSAEVREMRLADLPQVLAIERASFARPWSEGLFRDELGNPDTRWWVVADSPWGVVGFAGLMQNLTDGHILDLAVRPDARGLGIGRALISALVERAAGLGILRMTLEVRPSNSVARALYEEAGFHSVGCRPGYYDDTDEDAVIMWTGELASAEGVEMRRRLAERAGDALEAFRPAAPPREEVTAGRELILAIETSCDETAAAVMRGGRELLSSVVASQVDFHARFGGVVPEIASRKHTEAVVAVTAEALERADVTFGDLSAIAVTQGPGLVGALVVGLAYAKGLSLATGLPLIGVNHLEGHIFANVLADPEVAPPLVALVVSGGHTSLVHMPSWGEYRTLGSTIDDAAGEAFDKVAKMLGLGYPGGPVLSALAKEGDPKAIRFPRALINSGDYDFSLSGLKTAVLTYIRHEHEAGREIDQADLAASFQAAVVDVQVAKAVRAVKECGVRMFCLAGGVAANPSLRDGLKAALEPLGVKVSVPPLTFCTDNAAMIAAAAHYRLSRGEIIGLDAEALPDLPLG